MTHLSRRRFALGAAALPLAACGNGIGSNGAAEIDARVSSTLSFMDQTYPGTRDLASRASGVLVMPLVTEIGLGFGGSYGRGALRVGESTVDYYSAASGSAGLQIGAQQYSHVLFFMTPDADLEYAISDEGEVLRAETTTSLSPVIAVIFGQAGLRLGATLEGTKYTRIIP